MDHQDVQQQKDFYNTLFTPEVSTENIQRGNGNGNENHHSSMYGGALPSSSQATMAPSNPVIPNVPLNFDLMTQLMGIQGQQSGSMSQGQYSPQVMLEQRLKLNQLQQLQLQNQILQQQLELLNGQGSTSSIDATGDRQKPQNHFLGLPTPVNSTELHAQSSPNTDYISPITLGYVDTSHYRSNGQSQLPPDMHLPHHMATSHDARSAPANLVFNTTPPIPLPSPGDLDFDLSPLSPWMDAYKPDSSQQSRRSKRTASPHDDDQAKLARQRPSPSPRVPPTPSSAKRAPRGTRSASSTPLLRSTRTGGRKNSSGGEIPGDTPSPVDLSMPPPVAPTQPSELHTLSSSTNTPLTNSSPTSTNGHFQNMTPVTPASIMNLGGLGINSSLAPPTTTATTTVKIDAKGRSVTRGKDNSTSVSAAKKGNGVPLVSPSLKPILPAGNVYASNSFASSSLPSPVLRKTSHKAAEQKRRDSLKTTFDDLRTLLPPIPLPTEEGFPDEPILPGAMPPRGPPRGNADGPNRGISKLQLLRCGNDYIRLLKEKISRRDNEITLLRSEVQRLRELISEDVWREGAEELDLERDIDHGELGLWRRGSSAYEADDMEEDMAE
ncbi:hypothetical protein B0F90DRAFT_1818540 [Multifurca ochricompacta]|uniref:BHLH domain-containing protein n=1 Tax=Multifurca ochricompacta TaxID=376703 RepID=A0AAD4M355_9AGAM|nr:hypothetical protein B0F90DRAFT_1818540 [Multifurca ochricompacta]